LTAEPGPRRGPGPLVRALDRAVNSAVARFPWSWRLFSGPVRRFFDSDAVGWDERVRSDSPDGWPTAPATTRRPGPGSRKPSTRTGARPVSTASSLNPKPFG
jgi:hypothetical protein